MKTGLALPKNVTDVDSDIIAVHVEVEDELKKFMAMPAAAGVLSMNWADAAAVTTTEPLEAGIGAAVLVEVVIGVYDAVGPIAANVVLW